MTHALRPHFLLLAAAVSFASTAALATPVQGEQAIPPRTISVVGHGEVSVAPDEARVSMAVRITNTDLPAAEKKVEAVVKAYAAKATALGIAKADLSTAGYSVQPQYDYGKDGRIFRGYQVTRNIHLTVRDLGKVGDYLQAATAVGVNEVSAVQLESSGASKYRVQALAKAAKDAEAQARALASALNMKLGPARNVSTADSIPSPRPVMLRAMAMPSAGSPNTGNEEMGFSAGLVDYKADVHADFDISP